VRPDTSQNQQTANTRGVSMVAVRPAATGDNCASVSRASQLSVALGALAQELASARREIRALKRENAALRFRQDGGSAT
jgi:hypothetical protein